jgi:hypothetical protein
MDCWRDMVKYNKQDVLLLEKVYKRFLPYIADHPSHAIYREEDVCPKCGSADLKSWGIVRTATRTYRRLKCMDCGGWARNTKGLGKTGVTNAVS